MMITGSDTNMQTPVSSVPSSPALSDDSLSQDYQSTLARSRWKILAQALQKTGPLTAMPSSVRRFKSFGLVSALPLENIREHDAAWFEYCATIGQEYFSVLVRHPHRNITACDLMGFNNTGNICVWPSEEVLAHYGLCNRNLFDCKSVLEIGGGMSCLAGLMIGKYTSASKVHLTDGNVFSMDNVAHILEKNGFVENSHVTSSVLEWGWHPKGLVGSQSLQPNKLCNKMALTQYDIILCADCLFFDDVRQDLVQTIFELMADDGMALLTAPRRAGTLKTFCDEAMLAGLQCLVRETYDEHIWDRHILLKSKNDGNYDEDIHYPLLLQLQKN